MTEFPADFLWGVATAAYQIEGAAAEGGRGPSTWDVFCAEPGRIHNGDAGAVATDHYHRYREDVALIRELGVGAYRFSISWSRVLPCGTGIVNRVGLDFYDRLVDELCEAGVAPATTLFHWDTPQALEEAGGWLNRDIAHRFAEYAQVVGGKLGDRIRMWTPLHEPAALALFGYALGAHAPGRALGFAALPVAHHLLLGHGLAAQALRAAGCREIGIATHWQPGWPPGRTGSEPDAAGTPANWLCADPILTGRYPDLPDRPGGFAEVMPGPVAEDLAVISTPLDWYGINCRQPAWLAASGRSSHGADGLRQILAAFQQRYGCRLPPVHITGSGCSGDDGPPVHGRVADPKRIEHHEAHLRAVRRAMDEGVDVRGYFVWSLLDGFEWAEGRRKRFGLVHVDSDTLARTPKDSYHWFRELIAAQRRPR